MITGERRHEATKRERGHEYTECRYGAFTRSIELPGGADPTNVEAVLRNGVLEVYVAKHESLPRHVTVRDVSTRTLDAAGRRDGERERYQATASAPQ